ncbi:MAG TPA: FAD-dependent monooxygenase [Candidatus Binatia bacterium]|nr:FAD-dependent monooxygenase [Candidatus Binatia bacterium]
MAIDVPVLIVGGGPVGLMSAILLRRQGVACRVIERRHEPQRAPAAHVVNARTFEICRAAGVDMDAVAAACKPPADAGRVLWVTTLAGEELGRLPFERQGDDVLDVTPTPLRNLSQHCFEPILHATLERLGGEVRFGEEWESAEEKGDRVVSRIRTVTGTIEIESRWLVAADGAASRVRKSAGVEMLGPGRLQSFVMIHFEANLRGLVGERPGVLYWTTAPGATGTFVAHDIDSTWVYMHPWDSDRESESDYGEEACSAIVRRALGTGAARFAIRTIRPWTMTAQVAASYRAGRTFLVGDSAHRFPPTGGLGLNTGVQDAHNLAWKIAAVERGWAGEALLETYETERRPTAQRNADVSLANAARLLDVYQALAGDGDGDGDEGRRARIAGAIANQAEHFDMLGLQLGVAYEEGALLDDGTPPPALANPVRELVQTARPGARVPHAWVERAEARVSSLDLFALDRFTLVTTGAGAAWIDAAARVGMGASRSGGAARVPIDRVVIGRDVLDPSGRWTELLGIAPDGAVLVRPDQHVAWRAPRGVPDAYGALARAIDAIVPA